ncbi:MAG: hypothetical protein U9N62_06690 [Thermotogota bacterium]|nr:hypothetical protein [Thermotogota bacterium]
MESNDFYINLLEGLHEGVGTHCYDNLLVHVDDKGNNLCTGLCPLAKTIQPLEKFAGNHGG